MSILLGRPSIKKNQGLAPRSCFTSNHQYPNLIGDCRRDSASRRIGCTQNGSGLLVQLGVPSVQSNSSIRIGVRSGETPTLWLTLAAAPL